MNSPTEASQASPPSMTPVVPVASRRDGDCLPQVVATNPSALSPHKPSAATGGTRDREEGGGSGAFKAAPAVVVDGLQSLWTVDIRDAVVSLDCIRTGVNVERGWGQRIECSWPDLA